MNMNISKFRICIFFCSLNNRFSMVGNQELALVLALI